MISAVPRVEQDIVCGTKLEDSARAAQPVW